ncbi:hypothetical protein ACFQPG_08190 [Sphingomonas sp. GCM10030256]|uniref:hypothetical protein n=1 Tax=Sphingomonas sp. GCM10030256 TaxID=3273427 RepID=UPI0036171C16
MSTLEFYQERAAECRQQADSTTLTNVRDRCLSAASAWDHMADRLRRTQTYRATDAARKAGDPAAEIDPALSRET